MKCIYCLQDREEKLFSKAEHVIPQAFGRFKDNLVLNSEPCKKMVCDNCNQFFGDNLELSLGRDSLEGMFRSEWLVQKPEKFKPPGKNCRISITVQDGPLKGAYPGILIEKASCTQRI